MYARSLEQTLKAMKSSRRSPAGFFSRFPWHTSNDREARAFGEERPGLRATTLVIDGQQRLTSLYAVMRGAEIVDKDGSPRKITIAFRPRDGRFEVADAAIRKDPEFLPNVTELWSGTRPKPQLRRDIINALR